MADCSSTRVLAGLPPLEYRWVLIVGLLDYCVITGKSAGHSLTSLDQLGLLAVRWYLGGILFG